jgi:DNA-binding transcriptional MerR regulator
MKPDRLGLLEPRRGASQHRLYTAGDVAVLEQIVALKFIGISLRDIKRLLRTRPEELGPVLAAQRAILEEKRRRLGLAIEAIRQAQDAARQTDTLQHVIEVIKMQEKRDEFRKQYDAMLQGKIERLQALSPEVREQMRAQFAQLCGEIQGALDEDPAGPRARSSPGGGSNCWPLFRQPARSIRSS